MLVDTTRVMFFSLLFSQLPVLKYLLFSRWLVYLGYREHLLAFHCIGSRARSLRIVQLNWSYDHTEHLRIFHGWFVGPFDFRVGYSTSSLLVYLDGLLLLVLLILVLLLEPETDPSDCFMFDLSPKGHPGDSECWTTWELERNKRTLETEKMQ